MLQVENYTIEDEIRVRLLHNYSEHDSNFQVTYKPTKAFRRHFSLCSLRNDRHAYISGGDNVGTAERYDFRYDEWE